jgi:hypothetical protein
VHKGTVEQASPMTILVVAVAFTTGLLAGCSSMTTSPLQDASSRTELAPGASMQGAGAARLPDDAPPRDTGGSPVLPPAPVAPPPGAAPDATIVLARFSPGGVPVSHLNERAADVAANKKGGLSNGRWSLNVPAGAIPEDATVTLGIPSSKSTGCELTIDPGQLDPASATMTLTADCHGISPQKLAGYAMYRYEPDTQSWTQVAGSQVDTKRKSVSAPVTRFGIYAVGMPGKSGW